MRPVEDNSGLGGSAGIITDDSTQEGVSGFSTGTPKKLISSFCQNGLLKLQHFVCTLLLLQSHVILYC